MLWDWFVNPRNFARTIISIVAIGLFFAILSVVPSAGDVAHRSFIEILGKYDIFSSWVSVLEDSIDYNKMTSDNTIRIVEQSGIWNDVLEGFIFVFFNAILEVLACGICIAILENFLGRKRWKLLCNGIGIASGLFIVSILTAISDDNIQQSIINQVLTIFILIIGIVLVLRSTRTYKSERENKTKLVPSAMTFVKNIIWDCLMALTSTLYISVLCLASGRVIPRVSIIIVSIVYILMLVLDYFFSKFNDSCKKS